MYLSFTKRRRSDEDDVTHSTTSIIDLCVLNERRATNGSPVSRYSAMNNRSKTMQRSIVAMFLLSGNAISEKGETPPPEFRLANVFNSKMVIQCDKEIAKVEE